jgi:plasmid stabilization system protein ParE
MRFYLRPQAEADLALCIAEDNVQAARRWIEDMHALCQQLGEMPSMGVAKSSIRPGLRLLPAGSYLILYQQVDKGVEIARCSTARANGKTFYRQ